MYVAFDQLPPESRVWIYQANRQLTGPEIVATLPSLARFAEEWTSHGRSLHASAQFLHQQFLIIGLDEGIAGASGCSIDASVRIRGAVGAAIGGRAAGEVQPCVSASRAGGAAEAQRAERMR
jgi:hypothetical protein